MIFIIMLLFEILFYKKFGVKEYPIHVLHGLGGYLVVLNQ